MLISLAAKGVEISLIGVLVTLCLTTTLGVFFAWTLGLNGVNRKRVILDQYGSALEPNFMVLMGCLALRFGLK